MKIQLIPACLLLAALALQIAAAKVMPENQAIAGLIGTLVVSFSGAVVQKADLAA